MNKRILLIAFVSIIIVISLLISRDNGPNFDKLLMEEGPYGFAVPVYMNTKKYLFLLDTGATSSAVNLKILGNVPQSRTKHNRIIKTAIGTELDLDIINIPEISFGEFRLKNCDLLTGNINFPVGIDGILGMDILKNYNFKVRFKDRILELTETYNSQNTTAAYTASCVFALEGGVVISRNCLIDTGSKFGISLNDIKINKNVIHSERIFSDLSSPYIKSFLINLDGLKLGEFTVDNGLALIVQSSDTIGLPFLKNFDILVNPTDLTVTFEIVEKEYKYFYSWCKFENARKCYEEGKLDESIRYLKESFVDDNSDYRIYMLLSIIYVTKGKLEDARQTIDKAIKCFKVDPYLYVLKARVFRETGEYEKSLVALDEAKEYGITAEVVTEAELLIRYKQKKYNEAKKLIAKLMKFVENGYELDEMTKEELEDIAQLMKTEEQQSGHPERTSETPASMSPSTEAQNK